MDLARFDWDENNIRQVERHYITPEEAEQVLDNDPLYQYPQQADEEKHYLVYGETNAGRLLAVALTVRGDRIRVITAYDMDADQKRRYLQERLQSAHPSSSPMRSSPVGSRAPRAAA